MNRYRPPLHPLLPLLIALVAFDCSAAGFALLEQSVYGMGQAYAGSTAGGEDISTLFYNPAVLSDHAGTELLTGGHLVLPDVQFAVERSADLLNRPLSGNRTVSAAENTLIPNLYFATDLYGPFRLGLGITAPFGLGTKFPTSWPGRYEAIDSELKTVDFNPAVSFRINDRLSVGAGFSAQYLHIELTNAIDFGALCFARLGASACTGLGLAPQSADGEFALRADGWSFGYNAGLLFEPVPNLRLGIAYRSEIHHPVEGSGEFQVPDSARLFTAGGAFTNTRVSSGSYVPASLSFGARFDATPRWRLLFDLTWTEWGRLDSSGINFDNPAQPSTTLTFNFKDTLRTAVGVRYAIDSAWSVRSGFSFDESPVRDTRSRTLQVPDSDRYWLAAGISYRPSPSVRFDLSYAHVFVRDAQVDRTDRFGHRIQGTLTSRFDILSAALQVRF